MPSDPITDNIAGICLATWAAVLVDSPAGIVLAGPDFSIPVHDEIWEQKYRQDFRTCALEAYLQTTDFAQAKKAVSESVARASLDGYNGYIRLLQEIDRATMACRVLLRPIYNIWPDAALPLVPWAGSTPSTPVPVYDRIFPALYRLDAAAVDLENEDPGGQADIDTWCAANPDRLCLSGGGTAYCGFNKARGQTGYLPVETVDMAKPWRIIPQPDGSEIIAPALPVRLAEPLLGYYEAIL